MKFEWDNKKAESNLKKHAVSFEEAESAFGDPHAALFPDKDHSIEEKREIIITYSNRQRLLVISFTKRPGDVVRIISVRRADREELRNQENERNG